MSSSSKRARTAPVHPDIPGFTAHTLELRGELREHKRALAHQSMGSLSVETRQGRDTLWIIVRRPKRGGIALRTARNAGAISVRAGRPQNGASIWNLDTASGAFTVALRVLNNQLLRVTVSLKPADDLLVSFWPRDLYPLDQNDDPTGATGCVEAAQRGINAGICYFCLNKPAFGRVLYVQNLTALNPYFVATKAMPDSVVGGEWPELGYQPPTAPMGNSPPVSPLASRTEVVISDALIAFRDVCTTDEQTGAAQFIEMLADIYPYLDRPEPQFHDWLGRSEKTRRDLQRSPKATIVHYGHTYLHPYTDSEYPDSMAQMSVLSSMRDYEHAFQKPMAFADALAAGMPRFFDKKLGVIRRYLPNVGDDKNKDAVDSWYLYHPLMNLGRIALRSDPMAKRLFLGSIGFAIEAGRHFNYKWPIQYDVTDFSVIEPCRNAQGLGQTDVGGLYALVMVQAYQLTDDTKFLAEAKAALRALEGFGFELAYQTNLTAWGAVACMHLWRLEKNDDFLAQSLTFVASFLHNCLLWDSQIEGANRYANFFGVTCLHDASYLAAYEAFEAFAAFDDYLHLADDSLPQSVRLLMTEYRRYALDVTWYFYPDALPKGGIATDDIRNGHIDRGLSFPLEDLYGDGRPAGKVGQEIYGAGAAFVFASRAFLECGDAPFRLFADCPAVVELGDDGEAVVRLRGPAGGQARVRVLKKNRQLLPRFSATASKRGPVLKALRRAADFREYALAANGSLWLRWPPSGKGNRLSSSATASSPSRRGHLARVLRRRTVYRSRTLRGTVAAD